VSFLFPELWNTIGTRSAGGSRPRETTLGFRHCRVQWFCRWEETEASAAFVAMSAGADSDAAVWSIDRKGGRECGTLPMGRTGRGFLLKSVVPKVIFRPGGQR
jgi:hypothetical protein